MISNLPVCAFKRHNCKIVVLQFGNEREKMTSSETCAKDEKFSKLGRKNRPTRYSPKIAVFFSHYPARPSHTHLLPHTSTPVPLTLIHIHPLPRYPVLHSPCVPYQPSPPIRLKPNDQPNPAPTQPVCQSIHLSPTPSTKTCFSGEWMAVGGWPWVDGCGWLADGQQWVDSHVEKISSWRMDYSQSTLRFYRENKNLGLKAHCVFIAKQKNLGKTE